MVTIHLPTDWKPHGVPLRLELLLNPLEIHGCILSLPVTHRVTRGITQRVQELMGGPDGVTQGSCRGKCLRLLALLALLALLVRQALVLMAQGKE